MGKKDDELIKLTARLEKEYRAGIQAEYQRAYNEMRTVVAGFADKISSGGTLMRSEMYKYDRFNKLMSQLLAQLNVLKTVQEPGFKAYLVDQYQLNYFYSGYILETEYQVKLAYANIPGSTISRGIMTPMNKIALKSNKSIIQDRIQRSIVQSIAQGEGVRASSARIKKDLEQNANNAVRIARTETTRVMNGAKQDSYVHANKMGLPLLKKWVASLDGSTRDSHASLDGEEVETSKAFSNGLMHPGDQSGPPEEVINCRCSMVTTVKGYDNPYEFRKARGTDGKNEVIPYTTYKDWAKGRVK